MIHPRVACTVCLLLAACGLARAATPDQVDKSIQGGVTYLYAQMHGDNWEKSPGPNPAYAQQAYMIDGPQWGGMTALATLTLLAAGENPSDPRLASAVNFLETHEFKTTYATAVRAQVWGFLNYEHSPQIKAMINKDTQSLLDSVVENGPNAGMYGYWLAAYQPPPPAGAKNNNDVWLDHSNSQLAVLGVWALAETHIVEIPRSYWELVQAHWLKAQQPDGSWFYRNQEPGNGAYMRHSASMTTSGIATLYITQDWLRDTSGCRGNADNPAIAAGIKWLGGNLNDIWTAWAPIGQPGIYDKLNYYAAYGLERVGQASGRKYLGDANTNWFQFGADKLAASTNGWGSVPDTCLALLFLVHGRAPLMLNKLEYKIDTHGDKTKDADWNQRPHDALNLARWTGRATELEFGWQIVNLNVPVDDLHDAPILYIAGDQDVDFTKEEEAKLKQFVEEGGLIMCNADCSSSRFTAAIKKLGTRLFPMAEFRELSQDHPIFTNEQFPRTLWTAKPSVEGLSYGAREFMILFPKDDPARFWQSGAYGGREAYHNLAADIFEYIAGNITKLKKGRTFIVRPGAGGGRAIRVARLQYGGMWDPEPGGWRRLAAIMHNAGQAEVSAETVNLGDGKLSGYSVAHLTGTYAIHLTDAQRAELKDFISHGGTLIVDACGGSAAFTASVENELTAIFNKPAFTTLKADHAVYAAGPKIDPFQYRRYARKVVGDRMTGPRLRGMELNGRIAVFLSGEDLSTGLVGVPVDGIYGYEPITAVAIMEDMLLYSAH